jgi:phage shock protein PspC (stress-responsive transcriptional regulator)
MVDEVAMGDTCTMVDPTPTGSPPGDSPPPGFPPTPPPPVSRPELRLASGDKWLAGVAGGIARTLGIPSWAVRLAFVLLTMFGGIMIFAYLALWFFLPDESGRVIAREVTAGNESWLPVAGVVFLALAFGATLGIFGGNDAGILVPAVLVGGGIALLAGRDRAAPIPLSASTPPPGPPPVPPTNPSFTTSAGSAAPLASAPPAPPPPTTSYPPIPPPRIAPYEVVPTPPPAPRPPKPRSFLAPLTLSALAIAGGAAFLLDRAGHIDVRVSSMLAIALIVVGAVLVLATWVGRARGLIAIGLVLLPIAALAAVTLPFHKGLGQQRYAPIAATEQLVYEYGIGELTIDLRDLDHRGTADVRAELGIGSLVVIVPGDVTVDVHGEAGAGEIRVTEALELFGPFGRADDTTVRTESGLGAELDQTLEADTETARRIDLDAEVGMGEVVIRRDIASS